MNLFKVSISLFFATAIAACSSVDTGSATREVSCFDTGDGVVCVEGLPGDGADADGDGTADSLLCEDISTLSGDESGGPSTDDGDDGEEDHDAVGDDDSTSDQDGDGTTDSNDDDDDGDGVNDSQDSDDDGDGIADDEDCDNVDPNGDLPPAGDIPL